MTGPSKSTNILNALDSKNCLNFRTKILQSCELVGVSISAVVVQEREAWLALLQLAAFVEEAVR